MKTALIFSGQGVQKVKMAQSLYENSDIAKQLFVQANEILDFDLQKICFEGPDDLLIQTKICQPALFVHGYIIYQILKSNNLLNNLTTTLGLSLGEITAHAAAGTFDFETGLNIVAKRGELMQKACESTDGTMASFIGGNLETLREMAQEFDFDIANLNNPGQVVISGPTVAVTAAVTVAKERGFRMAIPLKVAGAYHSRLMESARAEFEAYLQGVEFKQPIVTVFTNTTAKAVASAKEIRQALVDQVVSSVLWEDCMRNAQALGVDQFYECGPGGALAGMAKRIDKTMNVKSIEEYTDLPLEVTEKA